jgi:hypothetical protein
MRSPAPTTLLIAHAIALALLAATPARAEPTLAEAHRAHYLGQHDRALQLYAGLAARGNAEAAERAGFMLLRRTNGCTAAVAREADRATGLLLQAAHAGRPAASAMLDLLDGVGD